MRHYSQSKARGCAKQSPDLVRHFIAPLNLLLRRQLLININFILPAGKCFMPNYNKK